MILTELQLINPLKVLTLTVPLLDNRLQMCQTPTLVSQGIFQNKWSIRYQKTGLSSPKQIFNAPNIMNSAPTFIDIIVT